MKRILLLSLALAALMPLGAQASHGGRTESGTVSLPAPGSSETGTVTRHVRCGYTAAGVNDTFGHVSVITEDEADGEHTFTLGGGGADWDVVFYLDLATCDTNASVAGEFLTVGAGESGTVPEGATRAISVFTTPGTDVPFTLTIS